MLAKLKNLLIKAEGALYRFLDAQVPVIHTFWQSFLAVFGLGALGILSSVMKTHNFSDAKSAGIALMVASVSAGFAAVKAAYLKRRG